MAWPDISPARELKVGLLYTHRTHRPNRLDCRKVNGEYRITDRNGGKSKFNREDAMVLKGMLEVALKI